MPSTSQCVAATQTGSGRGGAVILRGSAEVIRPRPTQPLSPIDPSAVTLRKSLLQKEMTAFVSTNS